MKAYFWLVEKAHPSALHGIFMNKESAERHLRETIPIYCAKGYFMDKTLTPDSFVVVEARENKQRRNRLAQST